MITATQDVVQWLESLPGMSDVRKVRVTIGEGRSAEVYIGARYTQTISEPASASGWFGPERTYERDVIYLLGDLPRVYRRRNKTVLMISGESHEWFVAGYWQGAPSEYHPFGAMFMLMPWTIPDSKIDRYERYPYTRVATTIEAPAQ